MIASWKRSPRISNCFDIHASCSKANCGNPTRFAKKLICLRNCDIASDALF
ncbi:unnamed protein product [Schistosoma mattheei]|uniref:Uncharacterized protein n=1 Tax=Schistosoma mattheei TaxID=31246 RepID=A0A3P8J2C5_9TREM|nr:unnamed protein product [Schistosoma mattheei]